MRQLASLWLLIPPLLAMAVPARAEGPPNRIIQSRERSFRIPFTAGSGERPLKELRLYYSVDQGKSWQPAATATPDQKSFKFETDRDGLYSFTVQTLDIDDRLFPESLDGAQPNLRVFIDTQKPVVHLRPLPSRSGEVG